MSFIEFAHNRSVHYISDHSLFEIVSCFKILTHLGLLSLHTNKMVNLDDNKNAKMVKKLNESVQQHIERKNEQYAFKVNEGYRCIIFEPCD